jgi:hypothetical protein
MFFWNKICGLLFAFLLFSVSSYAQNSPEFRSRQTGLFSTKKIISSDSSEFISSQSLLNKANNLSIIPGDFATCKYGFFCKKELMIEKAIKFPLRIRMGSLEQCNYYEGKR